MILMSIGLLVLILPSTECQGGAGAEDVQNHALFEQTEIVFLIDESGPEMVPHYEKVKNFLRHVPDYFVLGENSARAAVLFHRGNGGDRTGHNVFNNFVTDESLFRNFNAVQPPFDPDYYNDVYPFFTLPRKWVPYDENNIVIMLSNGFSIIDTLNTLPLKHRQRWLKRSADNALQGRRGGSQIYIAYIGQIPDIVRFYFNNYTADPTRVFPIEDFAKLQTITRAQREKILECDFQQVCRFAAQNQCGLIVWHGRDDPQCGKYSLPRKACRKADCEATCDLSWPWDEANCTGASGQMVKVGHGQPQPEMPVAGILEFCPEEKDFKCPEVKAMKRK